MSSPLNRGAHSRWWSVIWCWASGASAWWFHIINNSVWLYINIHIHIYISLIISGWEVGGWNTSFDNCDSPLKRNLWACLAKRHSSFVSLIILMTGWWDHSESNLNECSVSFFSSDQAHSSSLYNIFFFQVKQLSSWWILSSIRAV